MDKIKKRESIISSFANTIDAISWSLNLSSFILNETVKLSDFSHMSLSNRFPFLSPVNWNNSLEYADMLPLAVCAFYISACAEGYFKLFDGQEIKKEINPDLHSAQMILRILRNSLSHPYVSVDPSMIKIRWNARKPRYKKVFVVAKIDVTLDATDLDEKEFKLNDLGGWHNFLKLLRYLKDNL